MVVYKKALLIGINYKNSELKLNGCINDSNNLAQFRQLVRFANKNSKGSKNTVKLFLSYSGHGHFLKDNNNDESDGRDEVLCPVDCEKKGYIRDDFFKRILINKLNKNVEITILIDACHSGTMCDLKFNYDIDQKNTFKVYGNMKKTRCKCIMISGCKDNQVSMDALLENKQDENEQYQGAMTNSFLNCYQYDISSKNLIIKMRKFLRVKKFNQRPQLSSGKNLNVNKPFLNF